MTHRSFSRFLFGLALLAANPALAEEPPTIHAFPSTLQAICAADPAVAWSSCANEAIRRIVADEPLEHAEIPTVRIIEVSAPNAHLTPDGNIVVTSGLLKFIRNHAALTFILGHELGHGLLERTHGRATASMAPGAPGLEEIEADRYALQVLKRSGIPVEGLPELLIALDRSAPHSNLPQMAYRGSLKMRAEEIQHVVSESTR